MEKASMARHDKASFLESLKAVGASFFGVRGRGAHERDFSRLDPLHVIAAGIGLAIVFVLVLVMVVKSVVGT